MTVEVVPFAEAIEDVSSGNIKIPRSEFLRSGRLAVVDQGQSLIAGFTDDGAAAVRTPAPVIVFGDHTRAFKFVDFPFAMGADGVKVLRTRDGFDPKFVYHYLRTCVLPNAGYSRHFKFLKEVAVPRPPPSEQRRIAAILDHADALRAKRRQVLGHLDSLVQSIFDNMFGRLAWTSQLNDLAEVQIGPFGSLLHKEDYMSGGVAVLNPMHIRGGVLCPDPSFSVSEEKAASLSQYRLRSGDVVLGRRGEMGRAGIVATQHQGMLCGTGSLILRPLGFDSRFLHAVVTSRRMRVHLERNALGATLPNLNAGIVRACPAPDASGFDQGEFAARIDTVRAVRARARRSVDVGNELFVSLQSRAFDGTL